MRSVSPRASSFWCAWQARGEGPHRGAGSGKRARGLRGSRATEESVLLVPVAVILDFIGVFAFAIFGSYKKLLKRIQHLRHNRLRRAYSAWWRQRFEKSSCIVFLYTLPTTPTCM